MMTVFLTLIIDEQSMNDDRNLYFNHFKFHRSLTTLTNMSTQTQHNISPSAFCVCVFWKEERQEEKVDGYQSTHLRIFQVVIDSAHTHSQTQTALITQGLDRAQGCKRCSVTCCDHLFPLHSFTFPSRISFSNHLSPIRCNPDVAR